MTSRSSSAVRQHDLVKAVGTSRVGLVALSIASALFLAACNSNTELESRTVLTEENIAKLEQEVSEISSRIADLEMQDDLENAITVLTDQSTEISGQIELLEQQIQVLQSQVSSDLETISELAESLDDLKSCVNFEFSDAPSIFPKGPLFPGGDTC